MSDAPERIYLNLGNEETTYAEAVAAGWEVSWCEGEQDEWDVEYVRADLYEQRGERIAELEAEIERLKGGIEKWLREGVNKYDTCPHGKMWYEGCEACDELYFAALIAPQEQNNE